MTRDWAVGGFVSFTPETRRRTLATTRHTTIHILYAYTASIYNNKFPRVLNLITTIRQGI